MSQATYPARLEELVRQFEELPRQDRIDLLLEYADALPAVPAEIRIRIDPEPVHECQTPVTVYVEPDGDSARIYVEVGEAAPTIAAVASILIEGCAGAPRAEILAVPNTLPVRMIGPEMVGQRRIGLAALIDHVKRAVSRMGSNGG